MGNAWGDFKKSEINAVEDFVKNGGNLFVVGDGQSWQETGKDILTYPMNRLVESYDMKWIE